MPLHSARHWVAPLLLASLGIASQPIGAQQPAPNRIAIWAQGATGTGIDISGSENQVHGPVHSNASLKVSGSRNSTSAALTYVTTLQVSGSSNQFAQPPAKVAAQPLPYTIDVAAYAPGGAIQQELGATYFDKTAVCASQGKWQVSGAQLPLAPGVYYVPCEVHISGSTISGRSTIVSTRSVQVSGSQVTLTPFYRGIQIATSTTANDAIKLSGSRLEIGGLMWAPNGSIDPSGSEGKFFCGIVAKSFKLSGSKNLVGNGTCGGAPDARDTAVTTPEDTAVAIALDATDTDRDLVRYEIVAAPTRGTLSGTAPALTYTPAANYHGPDEFRFKVTDAYGQTDTARVAITVTPVNDAPSANAQSIASDEDSPLSLVLTGSDIENDALTFLIVTPPAHGTLSGTPPALVYTPAANYFGADSFEFRARDASRDSAPARVTIEVRERNGAPLALSAQVEVDEDGTLPIVLAGQDPDGDALSFELRSAPAHGTLEGTAPELRYTPSAGYYGPDAFTFVAKDGRSESAPATVSLTVRPVNDAPQADAQERDTPEGTAIALLLTGSDPEGDALSFELLEAPAHGTLEGTAPHLTYTPAPGYHGPDRFTFHVRDGSLPSAPAVVTLNVLPVNDAPSADDAAFETDEGQPVSIRLGASDPEGDALSYELRTPPSHGALSGSAPDLVYTPAPGYHGNDAFTFVAKDGALESAVATVSLTIRSVDDAPRALAQERQTNEDEPLTITLAGEDADGDSLSFEVVDAPAYGELSGSAPNLVYAPAAGYHGPDRFTFLVRDSTQASTPAAVILTVLPVNDAPTAQDAELQTDAGQSLPIVLVGSDPDGDTLSFVLSSAPAHGTLQGTAPALAYVPNPGFHGNDRFTFVVRDAALESRLATVAIEVRSVNDAPIAESLDVSGGSGQPLPLTLRASDPNGDVLSFAVRTQPSHGALSGTAPNLTYTPGSGFHGSDSFTFVASDGTLESTPATVRITIARENTAPRITSVAPFRVEEGQTYAYRVVGADQVGDVLTYGLENAPAEMTVANAAGDVAWPADSALVASIETPNVMCRRPALARTFDPVVKWHWKRTPGDTVNHDVLGPITVAQMNDDNGDGEVDSDDTPDAVFVSDTAAANYLNVVDGATGAQIVAQAVGYAGTGSLALGDLDDDGTPEIVGVVGNRSNVQVRRADGSILWTSPSGPLSSGASRDAPLIADLDADGSPEVINGNRVYAADGTLRWVGTKDNGGSHNYGLIPIAVDIDGDGKQELVAGRTAYRHDGSIMWHAPGRSNDGYTAFGNFDADPRPEFALVGGGGLALLDDNGSTKWVVSRLPVTGVGGPPTVADFDGDGQADIGVATANYYSVYNRLGQLMWKSEIEDYSSNQTGSSVFDFDHDGRAEVVFADELFLFVFDGATGTIRLKTPIGSGTTVEYPTVVDVDGDGSADILTGSNRSKNHREGDIVRRGVIAFGSATKNWAPTREIWNQHAYHVDNVYDDGGIPTSPVKSWLTHNSYRRNVFPDRHPLGLPDLAVFDLRLVHDDAGRRFEMRVRNRGQAPSAGNLRLELATGASRAAATVIETRLLGAIGFNQHVDVAIEVPDSVPLGAFAYASIDSGATVTECLENNNTSAVRLATARVTDQDGLADRQWFSVGVSNRNQAPVLQAATLPRGSAETDYGFDFEASDPDLGDGLAFRLLQKPQGMRIDAVSGQMSWQPLTNQAGTHSITVEVEDLGGLKVSRNFTLEIAANWPPEFTTQPSGEAVLGQPYSYQARATDPENHPFVFDVETGPEGLQIHAQSGLVTWTPGTLQVGRHVVEISAEDQLAAKTIQRFEIAVTDPNNRAPQITSTPLTEATAGETYRYLVLASDPDGDALQLSLTSGPEGMQLAEATGELSWTPIPAQVGTHAVQLRVDDRRGGTDVQEFQLVVEPAAVPNRAPVISSTPVQRVQAGTVWSYLVVANDPDGDAVSISLTQAPVGASRVGDTLSWSTTTADIGTHAIAVSVSDGRGATATQQFSLQVSADPVENRAPVISSTPQTSATSGQPWGYDVTATDADGDALTYALLNAPAGMALETSSLQWLPGAAQVGNHAFAVRVTDGRGGFAEQSIVLVVQAGETPINARPIITSTPTTTGKGGRLYTYAATATDADGDAIVWSLPTAPSGMTVDAATGAVRWTPAAAGPAVVTLRAADAGGYREQSWTIEVVDGLLPLAATLTFDPPSASAGEEIEATLVVENAGGPIMVDAALDGAPIALAPNATTEITAPASFGSHEIVVNVTASGEEVEIARSFTVINPNDTAGPEVTLLSPADHVEWDAIEITAPTEVRGSVLGDDVARWVLAVQESGGTTPRVIVEGTAAFAAGAIGTFDPTLLENGLYSLVLQAWDTSGNVSYDSRMVMVTGDMKFGHFSITFEEVSVPVAGIPVMVTRTYDTRRAGRSLDFGHGWTVDASSVKLQESRRPGFAWSAQQQGGPLGTQWCFSPMGAPIVTVRLPDGDLAKFRATVTPECQPISVNKVSLAFEELDGRGYALEQTNYGVLTWGNVEGYTVPILFDGAGVPEPADPRNYRLTTPEGLVYSVDQTLGLTRVDEPASNQHLTFSREGVLHSTGVGIVFVRDALGRITQMQLPDGTTRDYAYTAAGDLDAVTDPARHVTRFAYESDARFPHYLKDLIDPRGVRVSRNEYGPDGRLVATIDAAGFRLEYEHRLGQRTEIVRDRLGHPTVYVYDDAGRVLSETNAEGETTTRTYDAHGNELTTTNALDETTTRTFDSRLNLLTEENPAGETTTHTYNSKNQLLTQSDDSGRVVLRNTYDPRSHTLLTKTEDALGQQTDFAYVGGTGIFGNGQLESITDAAGQATGFGYDVKGYKTSETDALGNVTHFVNDAMGRVTEERRRRTLPDGSMQTLTTRYGYDANGNVTSVTHPDGSVTTTTYDGNDKPIQECDALQRCTETTYDARGNVARIDYPDGTFETKEYDRNGNLEVETDRGGRATMFIHDMANRLVRTIHPDGNTTRSEYDDAGRLIEAYDEHDRVTQYRYDAAGRQTEVIQVDPESGAAGAGPVVRSAYDSDGRRVSSTDPTGAVTRYVYDDAGRLIETVWPDANADDGNDANNPRTRIDYDAVGRKVAETDELGRTSRYAYDALGRLVAVVLPNPVTGANPPLVDGQSPDSGTLTTTYGYDEVGNKIRQTDAEGRTTRWEYDRMGRETARTLPAGQRETKEYNAAGELVAATDFLGKTTRYAYDDAGRPDTLDYPNDADVVTTYTDAGERETVTDGRGESTTAYDDRGRVLRSVDADGHVIEYQYDQAGNLLARISPSQSLSYQYDKLNRLVFVTRSVDGEEPTHTRYLYDAAGNRSMMIGSDGLETEYTYDRRHRLTNLVKKTAATGAVLLGMVYAVDGSGMRRSVVESDVQGTTRTVEWTYDPVKRLTREVIDHREAAKDRTTAWTYDAVGNRLTQTLNVAGATETTSYAYDTNDRLETETRTGGSSAGTTTYGYDANGNTVSKAAPSGMTTYRYDDANRLVGATTPEAEIGYVYDADGLRVRQTVTPNGGNSTTTWYAQDKGYAYAQVIEEYTSQGIGAKQLSATFTFADDLVSQTRYGATGTPTTRFVHADGFGSTRWLTNTSGAITDKVDYDAFGLELSRAGTTDIEHLYRSEAFDANVGFYYLRARWMNPSQGRLLSIDPFAGCAQCPLSLQKYLYAGADPIGLADPSGESFIVAELQGQSTRIAQQLRAVPAAFRAGARAGWRAIGNVGRVAERQVRRIIEDCLKPKMKGAYKPNPRIPGSTKRLDGLVELIEGVLHIEVKAGLPKVGSPALARLRDQLLAAQKAGIKPIVAIASKFERAEMDEVLKYLGKNGVNNVGPSSMLNGLVGLAAWLSETYAVSCVE